MIEGRIESWNLRYDNNELTIKVVGLFRPGDTLKYRLGHTIKILGEDEHYPPDIPDEDALKGHIRDLEYDLDTAQDEAHEYEEEAFRLSAQVDEKDEEIDRLEARIADLESERENA